MQSPDCLWSMTADLRRFRPTAALAFQSKTQAIVDNNSSPQIVNWSPPITKSAMATRFSRSGALASALRPAKPSSNCRNVQALRCLSTTAPQYVAVGAESKNMRSAPRDQAPGNLKAPIVNPADKYQSKAENLHRYGAWLMGCLPKYIQQFSLWKDELTIYIAPAGVLPVMQFLKCMLNSVYSSMIC